MSQRREGQQMFCDVHRVFDWCAHERAEVQAMHTGCRETIRQRDARIAQLERELSEARQRLEKAELAQGESTCQWNQWMQRAESAEADAKHWHFEHDRINSMYFDRLAFSCRLKVYRLLWEELKAAREALAEGVRLAGPIANYARAAQAIWPNSSGELISANWCAVTVEDLRALGAWHRKHAPDGGS